MILALLEKIRTIVTISEEELSNLRKLERILRCIMSVDPADDDVHLFMNESSEVVRSFLRSFSLDPWNYCHLLVTHMSDDMLLLREKGLSVGIMSMSRIENLGGQLKRHLKFRSNHQWCDRTNSKEHCFYQAIRLMMMVRQAHDKMRLDIGEETSDESDDEDDE